MRQGYINQSLRQRHKWRNVLHSILLLGGMAIVLALCAYGLFGPFGMIGVVIGGTIGIVAAPKISPEWVIKAHRGTRLTSHNSPRAIAILEELAKRADLSHTPALYYIPSRMLNAFATGNQDQSAIAITDGMLRRLSERELIGVLAHEVSHVDNNDLWLMGIADLLSRITSTLSYIGMFALAFSLFAVFLGLDGLPLWTMILLILAPTISSLLQMALSRAREYDADLEAASITGDPLGLASALAKLERIQGRYWEEIILPGRRMPDPSLLRTHPPTHERIEKLQALAAANFDQQPIPMPLAGLQYPEFSEPSPPRFIWPGLWR